MYFISKSIRLSSLLLFLLAISLVTIAQVEQSGRIEIPMDPMDFQSPKVISLDSAGLITYRRFFVNGKDQLELMRLDSTLQVKWRTLIEVNSNLNLIAAKALQKKVYFLYKYNINDFLVITVQIESGGYVAQSIKNYIPFNFYDLEVTPRALLIGGYFNYRPLVLYVDLITEKSKILPGFFNEQGEITQIKANADGTVDVVLAAKNMERTKCLWIRNYDEEGNLIKTIVITPDKNKNMIFGRSIKTADNRQIVAGVYGRFADYSRGIFISEINPYGEYKTDYYNFADFKNFFSYMRAKREQRVKDRIERRKIKGKKIKFNYRFLVHDLITMGNQVIMMGEAFFPHYSYRSRGFGGNTYYAYSQTRGDLVFDGFQYTHAVVVGFDINGKLMWDNSFEINDVRTMQLEQYVKMGIHDNRMVLLYLFENSIRSKIVNNSQVLEGKSNDAMRTNYTSDVVKKRDTQMSRLDNWYGNNFFAYGVQTIHSNAQKDESRKVFFINKISFK